MKALHKFLIAMATMVGSAAMVAAQNADIKILAVNDMHAALDNFPKFVYIVDSVRSVHPDVLLFSAGDNRTGNPVNDSYPESNFPMVDLMNRAGFNLSAMGNHECDAGTAMFANTINKSRFPYIVANIRPADTLAIHTSPFRIFDLPGGARLGVLGVLELNERGIPDCADASVEGIRFTDPYKEIENYAWMRDQVDALVLLSHFGVERDTIAADRFPMFDLIIGGHSHDLVKGMERNGVMITQAKNKLRYVNEIDLTVRDGKVVDRKVKTIPVAAATGVAQDVADKIARYADNPYLNTELTTALTPFTSVEEFGCLLGDALAYPDFVDISAVNAGSVRMDSKPAGPMTIGTALTLDPFDNALMVYEVTGDEMRQIITEIPIVDPEYGPGYVGGITYTMDTRGAKPKVEIHNTDGSKFNYKKTYRLGLSSYLANLLPTLKAKTPLPPNGMQTSDAIIEYLRAQPAVDYAGRRCRTIK